MKSFREIRENIKTLSEKTILSKRIKGVPVKLIKTSKGVKAIVDGDELDTFKDDKEAMDTVNAVIKEL